MASKDESSDEIFAKFQLKDITIAIYVLDKTLYDFAKDLRTFLTKSCNFNLCDKHCWESHLKETIAETYASFKNCHEVKHTIAFPQNNTCISIRSYGYLKEVIMEAKRRVKGNGLHHDVILILGHTSVMLAEDKDLIAAFSKIKPTIIAFLGCCGGNTRYGPILTMSYLLPAECSPVIAFYRRNVYKDELEETTLMIGLQYYLHFKNDKKLKLDDRMLARCAFGVAKLTGSVSPTDPTVFINDKDQENPIQRLLDICDLKIETVPLSCMQLVKCISLVAMVDLKQPSDIMGLPSHPYSDTKESPTEEISQQIQVTDDHDDDENVSIQFRNH